jgi:NADH:ubiquinone oxidoreductase subunit 2 (subunit N)
MSGVLIKMGIYGLARITSLSPLPPPWWGEALLVLGGISGVLGVGFALGQHDLKRLLAYHSVENIGIICLGLGVALLGRSSGSESMVVLAWRERCRTPESRALAFVLERRLRAARHGHARDRPAGGLQRGCRARRSPS